MTAAEYMVKSVSRGAAGWQQRPIRLSLCTYACAIFMMNGINYSVTEDHKQLDVVQQCMRHKVRTERSLLNPHGEPRLAPDTGCGAWFVADYVSDDLHAGLQRVAATGLAIDDNRLAVAYGCSSYSDLISRFGTNFFHPQSSRPDHIIRSRNRVLVSAMVSDHDADEEGAAEAFHPDVPFVVDADLTLLPPKESSGQDVRDLVDAGIEGALGNRQRADSAYVRSELSFIWRQLPIDVLSMAPNNKSSVEPSHCLLPQHGRALAKSEVFRSHDLSSLFIGAHVTYKTPQGWVDTFRNVFTRRTIYRDANQNLPNMASYRAWSQLAGRVAAKDFDRFEKPLLDQFKKLLWFPNAQSDKLWKTLSKPGVLGSRPEGMQGEDRKPRVFIAVNKAVYDSQPYALRFAGEELREREQQGGENMTARVLPCLQRAPSHAGSPRSLAGPSSGLAGRFLTGGLQPVTLSSKQRAPLVKTGVPRRSGVYPTPEPSNWRDRQRLQQQQRQNSRSAARTPVDGGELIDMTSEDWAEAGNWGKPGPVRQPAMLGEVIELSSSSEDELAFPSAFFFGQRKPAARPVASSSMRNLEDASTPTRKPQVRRLTSRLSCTSFKPL
jgi:hypothetical protein